MFSNYLDGGKVLFYTQKDNFGVVDYNNEKIININYLAICTYGNEQGYYLFFCDDKFKVVSDYFFDTIDECKAEAEKSKENIVWIEKNENKAEFRFDEIKDLLLKSIREYGCEAELRIFFANTSQKIP